MNSKVDVHKVFAEYFEESLRPIAYAVSKRLGEGHLCLNVTEYNQQLGEEDNPFLNEGIKLKIKGLGKYTHVTADPEKRQPFVVQGDKVYLHRYYEYESVIIEQIKMLVNAGKGERTTKEQDLKEQKAYIIKLFSGSAGKTTGLSEEEKIDWQLVATVTAVLNNLSIITGGPGTGKTTTVAKILALLFTMNADLKVALAAPTGKAAARINESIKSAIKKLKLGKKLKDQFEQMSASTIHRLLGYRKNSPYFRYNRENTLDFDVVIVDESSMIAGPMMAKLLEAINPTAKIILLGDKDQLASVEAGSVFGDLCLSVGDKMNQVNEADAKLVNSFIDKKEKEITKAFIDKKPSTELLQSSVIDLKRSYRFSAGGGIGIFSRAVIDGDPTVLDSYLEGNDEEVSISVDYTSKDFNSFIDCYKEYIQEKDIKTALRNLNDVRVLCALRSGHYGVYEYNKRIIRYLRSKKLIDPNATFYHNQPIMVTKNDYTLKLFNGDVGLVRENADGNLVAYFENSKGEIDEVPPGFLTNPETVFAMTIHKSQGSEFNKVVVVLPGKADIAILTRELLYTGVTRAIEKVLIMGAEETIRSTITKRVSRASGIQDRC